MGCGSGEETLSAPTYHPRIQNPASGILLFTFNSQPSTLDYSHVYRYRTLSPGP